MRKKINNYICFLVLFLCSLPVFGYEIPLYDVAYDKDIIVSLPYIKAEGVTATPIHSRLSVKIDKLIINGKKRIRGKRIWWWMGADETYALLNHQVANTKESIENIDKKKLIKDISLCTLHLSIQYPRFTKFQIQQKRFL